MNSRYAAVHGYHKEELLARFASGDAMLQRTEIDALLFYLFSFKNAFSGRGGPREIYSRIFTGDGASARPMLLWVLMGNTRLSCGQSKVRISPPTHPHPFHFLPTVEP
jgi:hypothetical protein